MTTTTMHRPTDNGPTPEPTRWNRLQRSLWLRLAVFVLVIAVLASIGLVFRSSHRPSDDPNRPVPVSAAMEHQLGLRFSRVAVVADGGLVTVFYVVLDPETAYRFQNDVAHRPVLHSESRDLTTKKVALMKQGHQLRAGQTYYLVYDNPGVLRPGEQVTITYGSLRLAHVPVL
jgi:hypothetical protein